MITNLFGFNVYIGKVVDKPKIDEIFNEIDMKSFTRPSDHWHCECFTGQNEGFIEGSDSWITDFINAILPNVEEYIETLKDGREFDYQMSFDLPWINVYETSNYQEIHAHLGSGNSNSLLSYAYVHKLPDKNAKFIFHNPSSSQIYLGQQNFDELLYTGPMKQFKPDLEEGTIIIFPSWVEHYVAPNKSKSERITISGNIKRIN